MVLAVPKLHCSYTTILSAGERTEKTVAAHKSNNWCIRSPDIDLLAVGLRPYYLPREFSHAIAVAVNIPPIHSTIAGLQTAHPSALITISGDFNHVSIKKTIPKFTQYVTCKTKEEKTLDLLYANVKDAYTSTSLPPLGRSDHILVLLTPCYVSLVKRLPVTTKTVRTWSEDCYEALQGCFEVMDWNALCEPHGEDITY